MSITRLSVEFEFLAKGHLPLQKPVVNYSLLKLAVFFYSSKYVTTELQFTIKKINAQIPETYGKLIYCGSRWHFSENYGIF